MKRLVSLLIFLLIPLFVQAGECTDKGTTIVYVNGIFTNNLEAQRDTKLLKDVFFLKSKQNEVNFLTAYNESHLEGFGDLVTAVSEAYGGVDSLELNPLLSQIHDQLTTQKVLLVGHSQGTFYTNALYEYLIQHGMDAKSVAVYNIATPADRVAGNGKYLTSSTDKVISQVVSLANVGKARLPLPSNITLDLSSQEQADPYGGHSLSAVYLPQAGDRIIQDMEQAIAGLSAGETRETCFEAPTTDAVYEDSRARLFHADLLSQAIVWVFKTGVNAVSTVFSTVTGLASHLSGASLLTAVSQNTPAAVFPEETVDEHSEEGVESAALEPSTSEQDQIDDLLEQIDILKSLIAQAQGKPPIAEPAAIPLDIPELPIKAVVAVAGKKSYPPLLISEVQAAGASDEKQEFVELYNPNASAIDLTGWYVQKKTATGTSWSSYASSTLFKNKLISAGGYFLVAREGYYGGVGNVFTSASITDNNSFVLRDPNGDAADKVGFGSPQDYEGSPAPAPTAGQSIGRKIAAGIEQETDNNLTDFEVQKLTPRAQNETYVPVIITPSDTLAPTTSFTVVAKQKSPEFTINFTITDPVGVVAPSGIAQYVFRWQESTEGSTWHEDNLAVVSGSPLVQAFTRQFTGEDEKTYYFQVKAKDNSGNESDWSPEIPASTTVAVSKKILINEIQTGGVIAKDEFIELYNPYEVAVDITGFALKKKTVTGTESNLISVSSKNFDGKMIPAKGYFLIAPPDNGDGTKNYTGSTVPDARYSGTSFSIAANNTVLLYDSYGDVIDKVGYGSAIDAEGSATVNPPDKLSIERKMIGQDTNNNADDFRISALSTPGKSFMQVQIQHATDYKGNITYAGVEPYYKERITWNSGSPNVAEYEVQYRLNGGNWQAWLKTTDTSGEFAAYTSLLETETVYEFRVRAKDISGNYSDWAVASADISLPVVINEINFYENGALGSQWIELRNRTDAEMSLTGWTIISKGLTINLTGSIPAHGYTMLRQDVDFTGLLSTTEARLYDNYNRFIDEMFNEGGWGPDDLLVDGEGKSLERISMYAFGGDHRNWKAHENTPGAQNSNDQRYTLINQDFFRDTMLPESLSPYVFVGDKIVDTGVTLTVEKGAVIKFYDIIASLLVKGNVRAIGEDGDEIVFTSFADDEYGGDSNMDKEVTAGVPGQWLGLRFVAGSQPSTFDYIRVRFAGATRGFSPPSWGKPFWVEGSDLTITNSIFEKNLPAPMVSSAAISLTDSHVLIDRVTFDNENAKAIFISGGSPDIQNSTFTNGSHGVYIAPSADTSISCTPTIQTNTFKKNDRPIFIEQNCYPVISSNEFTDNTYNAVMLGGDISQNMTLGEGVPYIVISPLLVKEGVTLTLEPGTQLFFDGSSSGLQIYGTLTAIGMADKPITFSAYESTTPGKWGGLYFSPTSQNSTLEQVVISYGGSASLSAALKVDQSTITMKNSEIRSNDNNAVWLKDSNSLLDGVVMIDNAKGLFIQGGSPEVKNSILQNKSTNISVQGGTPNLHDTDPDDPEKNTLIEP